MLSNMNFLYYIQKLGVPFQRGSINGLSFLTAIFGVNLVLTNIQTAILILIFCICFDFITGIYASYIESLEKQKIKVEGFWNKIAHFFFNTIESNKLRKSTMKTLAYFSLLFITYFIELIFFIEKTPISGEQEELKITVWVVGSFIAIEMYSAIFENMKRAGFDLKERIIKTLKGLKSLVQEIKDFISMFK